MSRLKGADLGVSVPGGTLNFRGDWSSSPSPGYAVSDLVVRNGIPYAAIALPGTADPAAVPGATTQASIASTSYFQRGGTLRAQSQVFTPSATVQVDIVSL